MDILKLSPSGRLSAGIRKRREPESPPLPFLSEWSHYIALVVKVHGVGEALRLVRNLGLSRVTNLHKNPQPAPRLRRGSLGISPYGRLLVRDGCAALEQIARRSTLTFATLTIPPSALVPQLFERWKDVVRNLRQKLVYRLRRAGLSGRLIGVVEIQGQRQLGEASLPALHLHIAFQGRSPGSHWSLSTQEIDKVWKDCLEAVLGFEVDVKASCNLQRVKKSVAAYLGKYLSKGSAAVSTVSHEYLPSSWYICTRPMLRLVRHMTRYLTGSAATKLYDWVRATDGLIKFNKDITLELSGGKIVCIGWYGYVTDFSAYCLIRDQLDSAIHLERGTCPVTNYLPYER